MCIKPFLLDSLPPSIYEPTSLPNLNPGLKSTSSFLPSIYLFIGHNKNDSFSSENWHEYEFYTLFNHTIVTTYFLL